MGMSDCVKCWSTPCTCGWDYRLYTLEHLIELRGVIDKAIEYKRTNPLPVFSRYLHEETPDDKVYMDSIKEGI